MSSNILISLVIGAVLIAAGILLLLLVSEPGPMLLWVVRVLVALGAGFIVAGLGGFIDLGGKIANLTLRAGGGIAVFLVVYAVNPPQLPGVRQVFKI